MIECPICHKKYTTKDSVNVHIKKFHMDEIPKGMTPRDFIDKCRMQKEDTPLERKARMELEGTMLLDYFDLYHIQFESLDCNAIMNLIECYDRSYLRFKSSYTFTEADDGIKVKAAPEDVFLIDKETRSFSISHNIYLVRSTNEDGDTVYKMDTTVAIHPLRIREFLYQLTKKMHVRIMGVTLSINRNLP